MNENLFGGVCSNKLHFEWRDDRTLREFNLNYQKPNISEIKGAIYQPKN
jgi:hypothetical protein